MISDFELSLILRANLDLLSIDENKQAFLDQCIASARDLIQREGICLVDSAEDTQLIVMYAAYLYRKRAVNEPMPRMLRFALNNRLLSEKAQ